jgi:hypothetical protein
MEREERNPECGKCEVVRFDSVGEAVRFVTASKSPAIGEYRDGGKSDFYGRDWKAVQKLQAHGDPEAVKRVTKILDQIDVSFRDREKDAWVPGVAGAYPVVPEFLSGEPECMRHRQPVTDDRSPLRIYLGICVSAGVSIETAQKRGAAVAALALRLNEERPVELWAVADMKCNGKTILVSFRIPTLSASANEIAFALGAIESLRRIGFGVIADLSGATNGGCIQWAWDGNPSSEKHLRSLRQALRLNEGDVLLPGGHLDEVNRMARDPVKWVHDKLESQRAVAEA